MVFLPFYLGAFFFAITFLTVFLFYRAAGKARVVPAVVGGWLLLQGIAGTSGFYLNTDSLPPRFLLLVLPPLFLIVMLFFTPKGRRFVDGLDLGTLTLLHGVRIFVELVLFGLYVYGAIPQLMTFEGWNFDILAGVSAPALYRYAFKDPKNGRSLLLVWNCISLALLVIIVALAVLSAPGPFQHLAFDQPNRALLQFPFLWLPGCIVPIVLLSHLAAIRQLVQGKR